MCPLAAGLGREGEGRNEGDQGKKKKERIKTLPCGQHCPSGIRDAHVVRKIILSLTKQEEGAGMEESDRSKQKVPQGFQSAGFKKKKNCLFPPSFLHWGAGSFPVPPATTTKRNGTGERAEGLFRISHPFYPAPSVLNFQDKNHKTRCFVGEADSEIFLLGTRKGRERQRVRESDS